VRIARGAAGTHPGPRRVTWLLRLPLPGIALSGSAVALNKAKGSIPKDIWQRLRRYEKTGLALTPKSLGPDRLPPTPIGGRDHPRACDAHQTGKGKAFMGLRWFKIGEREALELACDGVAHRGDRQTAWFDCGSDLGNLSLAIAAGWMERRNAKGTWLCPRCAQRDLKGDRVRNHADETPRGKGTF
jgi:hypothetical protein